MVRSGTACTWQVVMVWLVPLVVIKEHGQWMCSIFRVSNGEFGAFGEFFQW